MCLPASILSLLLAVILLSASIATTTAEDRSGGDVQQDVRQTYDSISFAGRKEFEVSDPVLVPRQLALAAEQSGCRYKDDIKELPVHFISAENRRLALVFCRFGVTGSHHVFDFADLRRPKLVQLPFIAQKEGFGTTPRPGMITWKRDAGVLRPKLERTPAPAHSSATPIGRALRQAGSARPQPSQSSALRLGKPGAAASSAVGTRYGKRRRGLNRR